MELKGLNYVEAIIQGVVISIIVTIILGVFGSIYESHFSLRTKIMDLTKDIDSLRMQLEITQHESKIIEKHIIERPNEGIACKVGVNFNLKGYIASVYANNPFGFKRQSHIVIYYNNEVGGSYVYVTIIVDSKLKNDADKADIYLSKDCFQSLGISSQYARRKGVFNMNYKIPVNDK